MFSDIETALNHDYITLVLYFSNLFLDESSVFWLRILDNKFIILHYTGNCWIEFAVHEIDGFVSYAEVHIIFLISECALG